MEPTWQTKRAALSSQSRRRDELLAGSDSHNQGGQGEGEVRASAAGMDPQIVAQRRMVHRGLQEHRQTTESAKRSLQVAESCLEISGAVLTEVQRQGESLDKTEKHMEEMEEEVVEAESLIKFMQKCCLFQVFCCCCTDKDVKRDKSRKARLRQRRQENERMIQALSRAREDRHRDLHELLHDEQGPPIVTMDGETSEQKDALKVAAKYHHGTSSTATIPFSAQGHGMSQRSNAAVQSGAITAEEIQEISEETLQQDKYLTQIDKTMDKLKAMGLELSRELHEQDEQISKIDETTYNTRMTLTSLSRQARKI